MSSLRTGELAKQAGVNVETLRFYEREGLLAEPPRRASGYREYPADTVQRIRFIQRAKELGFTLREIKGLLELRVDPDTTCAEVKEQAAEKVAAVQQKISDLKKIERALNKLMNTCRDTASIDECPILNHLEEEL
ncbi:Hg(II)-responsive transcriptional regulator [Aeoliella sp.]|uniref:Hg(II)-responsive transcriptional regulator n=1 Tax=Aeoliella sp. TaxID=2795800 RepID=UPI003CCBE894